MTVNEFIEMLRKNSKTGDEKIEFFSDEWTEDLDCKEYQERWLMEVCRNKDNIRIYISN